MILDAFQTIILPRRPTGRLRLTRLFYIATWKPWVWVTERLPSRRVREQVYSVFGPVSLLMLLMLWAVLLTVGFGLILFAMGSPFQDGSVLQATDQAAHLRTDLYVSGTTLTTLGPGDVVPRSQWVRGLMILESGTGLGFVALVIGYVPVLYGAFSKREVSVALLDARAGSPPTAAELLQRHGFDGGQEALIALLEEWERWSAEILESHISYPILCYYRSQHDNQSWLAALTAILDTCSLLITTVDGPAARQAQLTFAMARHALVDLGHVFHLEGRELTLLEYGTSKRLTPEMFGQLCEVMSEVEIRLCDEEGAAKRLAKISKLYEPQAQALSEYLKMPLPQWLPESRRTSPTKTDQWTTITSLRVGGRTVIGGVSHISEQAASAQLHDEDGHGF